MAKTGVIRNTKGHLATLRTPPKHGEKMPAHTRPKRLAKTAVEMETLQQRQEVLKLRIERKSYRQIAELMGISVGLVHKIVNAAMQEIADEVDNDARFYRALETKKLDELEAETDALIFGNIRFTEQISVKGEMITVDVDAAEIRLKAMDRKLKFMEHRAALWGLNATKKEEEKPASVVPIETLAINIGTLVLPMLGKIIAGEIIGDGTLIEE